MPETHSVCLLMVGEYAPNDECLVGAICQSLGWRFSRVGDFAPGLLSTRSDLAPVVMVQADIWKLLLREIQGATYPPNLVVTSRTADERLWAEVLNLGGYDVLAQPLDRDEVERVLASAARHIHWPRRTRKNPIRESVSYTATRSASAGSH
jgi:hypothetical protein